MMSKDKLRPLRRPNHLKRRLLWFCFFICFGGMAIFCIRGKVCLKAWQARGWPAVPCTIENSGINSEFKPGHAQTYHFSVIYRYSYGGQEYSSEVANLDPEAEIDLKTAGAMSDRYPQEGHATCFVNPLQPGEAVLDRSVSARDIGVTAFGGVMVLGGLVGLMVVRRKQGTGNFGL
jgi:hypothetical protein